MIDYIVMMQFKQLSSPRIKTYQAQVPKFVYNTFKKINNEQHEATNRKKIELNDQLQRKTKEKNEKENELQLKQQQLSEHTTRIVDQPKSNASSTQSTPKKKSIKDRLNDRKENQTKPNLSPNKNDILRLEKKITSLKKEIKRLDNQIISKQNTLQAIDLQTTSDSHNFFKDLPYIDLKRLIQQIPTSAKRRECLTSSLQAQEDTLGTVKNQTSTAIRRYLKTLNDLIILSSSNNHHITQRLSILRDFLYSEESTNTMSKPFHSQIEFFPLIDDQLIKHLHSTIK